MDTVTVLDSDGNVVDAQLLPVTQASLRLRNEHVNLYLGKNPENTLRYWLAFPVSVPPLGFSTYTLAPIKAGLLFSLLVNPTCLQVLFHCFHLFLRANVYITLKLQI